METYEEQQAFFNANWDDMRAAAEHGGAADVVRFIEGHSDDLERRVLYVFAHQELMNQEWAGRSLDVGIAVADAGIAELLRQAEAAGDEETRRKRTDTANVISYNLSADLADCWPDDHLRRERRHFELGLKAAQDCIRWRLELDKGPGPFAIAYWAQGMHELSLEDPHAAEDSFARSLEFARLAAREAKLGEEVDADGDFGVILSAGYVGLARMAGGRESGRELYEKASAAFALQLENPNLLEDAKFGLAQLNTVRQRYTSAMPAAAGAPDA